MGKEITMAKKIAVDISKMEHASQVLNTHAVSYELLYKQLISTAILNGTAWQGIDNLEYVKKLTRLSGDFQKNVKIIEDFSKSIKKSAKIYRETQSEIINDAKRLTN